MKIVRIGYLLLILGTVITGYKYVYRRKEIILEKNKIEYTLEKQVGYLKKDTDDLYDALLYIPQISLKKGIYKKDDVRNNIDENVTIHELSDYPNSGNSNLILMAHSGTGKKAFFSDINKLNEDSLIEFYYQGIKYVYKINKYYAVVKNGSINIDRDSTRKTITLITCDQEDKLKQLVYIGYLIDEIVL